MRRSFDAVLVILVRGAVWLLAGLRLLLLEVRGGGGESGEGRVDKRPRRCEMHMSKSVWKGWVV